MPPAAALRLEDLSPSKPKWAPAKMSWWYHSIIDYMIANPQSTKKEMAVHFKCSEMAIGLITNSDIFRAHFDARRSEYSKALDGSIHQKLGEIALKSLGFMAEVLEKKRDQIPLMQLNEISGKVLDRLGYGLQPDVKTPAPSVTVINAPSQTTTVVVPVSAQDLEAARAALRRSEAMKGIETARPMITIEPSVRAEGETALDGTRDNPEGEAERPDEPLL